MEKYYIRHTDISKDPIEIDEHDIDESSLDIALFGRVRAEYGERLNQNLLNLLENFAVGMDPFIVPPTPTPMPSQSTTPPPSASPTALPSPTPTKTPDTPTMTPTMTPTPTPTPSVMVVSLSGLVSGKLIGYSSNCTNPNNSNVVLTNYLTITTSGGSIDKRYSYSFEYISGDTQTSVYNYSPTSSVVRFQAGVNTSTVRQSIWRVRIMDENLNVIAYSNTFTVKISRCYE